MSIVSSQQNQPQYLTKRETATLCRFRNVRTLEDYLRAGTGPAHIRVTRKQILFERSAVIAWLQSHRVEPLPRGSR